MCDANILISRPMVSAGNELAAELRQSAEVFMNAGRISEPPCRHGGAVGQTRKGLQRDPVIIPVDR